MSKDLTPTEQHNALAVLLTDPDKLAAIPVETVERLWAIQQQIDEKRAHQEFITAKNCVEAQTVPVVMTGMNTHTRSPYATAQDVDAMLAPLLAANGFDCESWVEECTIPDHVLIKLRLSHVGGHAEVYTFPAPIDGTGMKSGRSMTRLHGTASSWSYATRHLKCKVFNLETVKDDDGNAGAGVGPSAEKISDVQAGDLLVLIKDTGADVAKFREFFGIENVEDLPVSRYREAVRMLERKRSK